MMFTKSLFPESRSDILKLIELIDKVPNGAEHAVQRLVIQHISIPREYTTEILELVRPLNHKLTWQNILAERAFLQAMGGGCSAAIACLGTVAGTTLRLQGMAAGSDGLLYASEEGSALAAEEVGVRLAQKMLEMGASEFIAEVRAR